MTQRFAPGWYLNPKGPGLRYWDGEGWTEDYQTIPVSPGAAKPRRWRLALAVALGLLLAAAALSLILGFP